MKKLPSSKIIYNEGTKTLVVNIYCIQVEELEQEMIRKDLNNLFGGYDEPEMAP